MRHLILQLLSLTVYSCFATNPPGQEALSSFKTEPLQSFPVIHSQNQQDSDDVNVLLPIDAYNYEQRELGSNEGLESAPLIKPVRVPTLSYKLVQVQGQQNLALSVFCPTLPAAETISLDHEGDLVELSDAFLKSSLIFAEYLDQVKQAALEANAHTFLSRFYTIMDLFKQLLYMACLPDEHNGNESDSIQSYGIDILRKSLLSGHLVELKHQLDLALVSSFLPSTNKSTFRLRQLIDLFHMEDAKEHSDLVSNILLECYYKGVALSGGYFFAVFVDSAYVPTQAFSSSRRCVLMLNTMQVLRSYRLLLVHDFQLNQDMTKSKRKESNGNGVVEISTMNVSALSNRLLYLLSVHYSFLDRLYCSEHADKFSFITNAIQNYYQHSLLPQIDDYSSKTAWRYVRHCMNLSRILGRPLNNLIMNGIFRPNIPIDIQPMNFHFSSSFLPDVDNDDDKEERTKERRKSLQWLGRKGQNVDWQINQMMEYYGKSYLRESVRKSLVTNPHVLLEHIISDESEYGFQVKMNRPEQVQRTIHLLVVIGLALTRFEFAFQRVINGHMLGYHHHHHKRNQTSSLHNGDYDNSVVQSLNKLDQCHHQLVHKLSSSLVNQFATAPFK